MKVVAQPLISLLKLDLLFLGRFITSIRRFVEYSRGVATERAQLDTLTSKDSKDFFHYITAAKDPDTGEGLSEAQVIAESALLIIAGIPSFILERQHPNFDDRI